MFEDIFNENLVIDEKPKKDFDNLDAKKLKSLQSNEIIVDEIVKNLEKLYKGIIIRGENFFISRYFWLQMNCWITVTKIVHRTMRFSLNATIRWKIRNLS